MVRISLFVSEWIIGEGGAKEKKSLGILLILYKISCRLQNKNDCYFTLSSR